MRFFQRRRETVRPCGCGPRGSSLGTQWRGRGVGETTRAHRGGPHTNCGLRAPKSALGEPKAPGKGGVDLTPAPNPPTHPGAAGVTQRRRPAAAKPSTPDPCHTPLRRRVYGSPFTRTLLRPRTPGRKAKERRRPGSPAQPGGAALGERGPRPPGRRDREGDGGAPDLPHCKDPGAQAGCSRGAASRLQVQASQPWRRRDPARGGPGSPHTHPRSSQRQL